jgi:hypothetical protein
MRRLLALAASLVVLGMSGAAQAAPDRSALPFRVPPGYRVVGHTWLAKGVEHVRLKSDRPEHVIEIGFVRRGASHRVDVRQAGQPSRGADRRMESTSDLCATTCTYGTNGDFFFHGDAPAYGRPVGGVVERGVVLVSPSPSHHQASFTYDGGFTTRRVTWSASVVRDDLALAVTGKNVPRGRSQLVLYTSDYVVSTGTNEFGAELVLKLSSGADNLPPNARSTASLVSLRDGRGNTRVAPGTVVLSGHGRSAMALRRLWQRGGRGALVEITEALAPGNVWASVGAGHILIRDGKRWMTRENAPFLTAAHPRTFAGVTRKGHLFQATVDGRARNEGRSAGMPLEEALRFFTAFGASEVVNMDGGGSTTFVRGGRVVNRPSDGAERLVANALVVVPGRIPRQPPAVPVPRTRHERPEVPEPGIAAPAVPVGPPPVLTAVAAGNILVLGGATFLMRRRRLVG